MNKNYLCGLLEKQNQDYRNIKSLNEQQLRDLSDEIRELII